jgi:AsmA protein
MKSLLKWSAIVVGVVVLFFVAAAVLLPLIFDPNDYKQALVEQVKEQTGRDLRIDGDIELSVFPWIGIDVGKVALSNAAGFAEPVFAGTDEVSIRVKLLPLLSKRVEMDTITVHGLTLNLARDAAGRNNWDDLAAAGSGAGATGTTDASGGQMAAAALAIGGLDIRDANLSWDDASQGQRFDISKLSMRTGAITTGEPVDVALALDVALGDPAIGGHIAAEGRLDYDQSRKLARMQGLQIRGEFSGEQLPGGEARVDVAADVEHDGVKQSLLIDALRLETSDLKLAGELRVDDLQKAPTTKGTIRIAEFNPKKLLAAFSEQPLETADPKALTRASLEATLGGRPNQLTVKPLTIRLDDSTLTGEIGVPDLSSQALRFELAVNAIDVDRYLPPQEEGDAGATAAATPGTAATGASEVPKEALRRLDVAGRMTIGELKAAKLTLTDVEMSVKAKDGLIRLNPFGARLYDGTYRGDIRVDARGKRLRTTVNEKLKGVQAGPLLKDLQGRDRITGTANVNIAMQTLGATPEEVKKSLKGTATFAFTDGAINGVNIPRMIREANARIKGIKLPPEKVEQKTDFSELRGSLQVEKGIARNDDFIAMTPLLRINGKGTANLPAETVDYRVKATVVRTLKGQGGEELRDLVGIPIPIHVTGTFAKPNYALDTQALAEAVAKSKVDDVIEEKVGDDAVKGLLKGLIK